MTDRFILDMLPAGDGDCIWIEYGPEKAPRRILVDGGRASCYKTLAARFADLPPSQKTFELLVCTHIDADHIAGLLKLIEDPALQVSFKDVWFNGAVHLRRPDGSEVFGTAQGDRLTDGIVNRGWNWNGAFGKRSVVVPESGDLPVKSLCGDMTIVLLSPNWAKLEKLRPIWPVQCELHGLIPGIDRMEPAPEAVERFGSLNIPEVERLAASPFEIDTTEANGSSIAFILCYRGISVLLTGDAHVDVMVESLDRYRNGSRLKLDAIKLSHHGSKGAVSSDFLERVDCEQFLISTNGKHDHPHREAIARVVTSRKEHTLLCGNYRPDTLLEWNIPRLREYFDFTVKVPGENNGTITVNLI